MVKIKGLFLRYTMCERPQIVYKLDTTELYRCKLSALVNISADVDDKCMYRVCIYFSRQYYT